MVLPAQAGVAAMSIFPCARPHDNVTKRTLPLPLSDVSVTDCSQIWVMIMRNRMILKGSHTHATDTQDVWRPQKNIHAANTTYDKTDIMSLFPKIEL